MVPSSRLTHKTLKSEWQCRNFTHFSGEFPPTLRKQNTQNSINPLTMAITGTHPCRFHCRGFSPHYSVNGAVIVSEASVAESGFLEGPLTRVDLRDGYTAVKWASATEFVTGCYGFGIQWWDQRRTGGPVTQFKGNWSQGKTSGIVHSVDIPPSRKHTCLAGGSSRIVFALDLRIPQQPISLSGTETGGATIHLLSESKVWEVQYDCYMRSSNISNISSSRILSVMMCSEGGILAVVEQGEEPIELLAEPCAINSFDIDRQNPSDVICSLEWESIAILTRPGYQEKNTKN
ncbi:hypothetical protein SLEP1_g28540 [Rubroshorea leprosula]|uniref:Uncharacterized protein n=1 Tax=Rubroshorea leprosula TaxID=152421 RepID=A0AAV5K3C3_9ROSI|nr:hypothetical protein SLEP1_g28540 [Rubroshorea leprosula]